MLRTRLLEQYFEKVHHEFILNLVVKTAQLCRYSIDDVQPILTELASILRIANREIKRVCATPSSFDELRVCRWASSKLQKGQGIRPIQ